MEGSSGEPRAGAVFGARSLSKCWNSRVWTMVRASILDRLLPLASTFSTDGSTWSSFPKGS